MKVYDLRKELEKWPQDSKVIFCVGTERSCCFTELQASDLHLDEPGTLVLAR